MPRCSRSRQRAAVRSSGSSRGPTAWQHWVSRAFLERLPHGDRASRRAARTGPFDPLLQALIVDKALYELGYELNSRPEWARIPLAALVTLALPLQR